jgi:hypothetical protein
VLGIDGAARSQAASGPMTQTLDPWHPAVRGKEKLEKLREAPDKQKLLEANNWYDL